MLSYVVRILCLLFPSVFIDIFLSFLLTSNFFLHTDSKMSKLASLTLMSANLKGSMGFGKKEDYTCNVPPIIGVSTECLGLG